MNAKRSPLTGLIVFACLFLGMACTKGDDPETARKRKMKFNLPALGRFHVRPLREVPPPGFNTWNIVRYEIWTSELLELTYSLSDPRTDWDITDSILCESNKRFILTCGYKKTMKGPLILLDFNEKPLIEPGPDEDYSVPPKEVIMGRNAGHTYFALPIDPIMNFAEFPSKSEVILSSWSWRPPARTSAGYNIKKSGPGARQTVLTINKKEFAYDVYPYPYWELTLSAEKKGE